jgi:hypothetical protein
MKKYAEWVITQVKFKGGETTYNLNRVMKSGNPEREWLHATRERLLLDIKLGKTISPVRQLLLQEPWPRCTVLETLDNLVEAKQKVNSYCDCDPMNIRSRRFRV